jgi:hypothetical protein
VNLLIPVGVILAEQDKGANILGCYKNHQVILFLFKVKKILDLQLNKWYKNRRQPSVVR